MTHTKKEREYYNLQRDRICQRLGITKNNYNWLRRKGEELHKVYEDDCNGVLELNYDNGEYDDYMKPFYRTIDAYVKELGLQVYYQTDPRGATIYLDNKPISDNAYTNASCIY